MSNSSIKKLNSNLKFVYSDNNSISVVFQNNDLLMGVVGEFNSNLKELEKLTNTNIYFRGNSIAIRGDKYANEKVINGGSMDGTILAYDNLNMTDNFAVYD